MNKHKNKKTEDNQSCFTKTKKPIFNMIQPCSKLIAMTVNNTRLETLMSIIKQFIAENTVIYTDESNSYSRLNKENYSHRFVRHNDNEYVSGDVYTNTIEGFWSHFKKMVFGTYHSVSKSIYRVTSTKKSIVGIHD